MTVPPENPPEQLSGKDEVHDPQNRNSAVKALQDVKLPEALVGTEPGHVTLNFDPKLSYVKVRFKFNNENIGITFEGEVGEEDCTFEFRFDENNKREKIFEIRATAVEKESSAAIDISCKDEQGNSLGATKRYWTKLKPTSELPDTWAKLVGRVLSWKTGWYVKYPVLLVVALGILFYIKPPTQIIEANFGRPWHDFQVKYLGKPPERLVSNGIDPLRTTVDGKPDPALWNAPGEWTVDKDNPAINISGDSVGVIRIPELNALYDYKVLLIIAVTSDNQRSASWLLRVQKNKEDYYLFRLTFPTSQNNQALLQGFVYEHGLEVRPLMVHAGDPIDYFNFHQGNILYINIEVKENIFTHEFYLAKVDPEDPNLKNRGIRRTRIFTDTTPARYPYGTLGFKCEDSTSQIKVVGLNISEIK